MPYTGIDDPSLPSNVKAMPAPARKAWVDTFTGMHDRCMKDGGVEADCEGQAMKMANAAAKRMMAEAENGTDTVELGHLGNLLKWHLDKNKISRGDLAAAMGYADASSVGRLLAGDIMDVSEEKLRAAARLLGVSADELLAAQHRDLVKAGRRQEENLVSGLLFTDLANLTPGKPFDGLMVGKWVDMHGQEVTVTPELVKALVPNTKKEIASRVDEQGNIVGLPIDASKHDKGDGAGWIVDCNEEEGRVRITPNWTELGVDKIGKGILRFFSATIDMARKVILGGTLTNWPAVKGLRAIELSEHPGVYSLQADETDLATKTEGGDAYPMRCFLSVPDEALPSSWGLRICETVAGAVTVTVPQLGRAAAALGPGFRGQKYQPKPGESIDGLKRKLKAEYKKQNVPDSEIPEYLSAPEANSQSIDDNEVIHMDLTEEKLAELIGQQVGKALEGMKPAEKPEKVETNGFDPVKLLEMQGVTDDFVETFKSQYLAQMAEMKKRATQEAEMMLAQERRNGQLTEFAQKVTGGNDETPRGLPIAPDKLKDALLKLPQGQEKFWMDLLTTVQQDGLVDFAEVGHGKIAKGTQPVPKDFTRALRQWVDAGQPVAEFFHLNELGDPSQYDLSGYEPKKEK